MAGVREARYHIQQKYVHVELEDENHYQADLMIVNYPQHRQHILQIMKLEPGVLLLPLILYQDYQCEGKHQQRIDYRVDCMYSHK